MFWDDDDDDNIADNVQFQQYVQDGNAVMVDHMLNNPSVQIDIDANNGFALFSACLKQHVDVVRVLLKSAKLDLSVNNGAILQYAIDSITTWRNDDGPWSDDPCNTDIIKLLLNDPRTDVTVNDHYVFRHAVFFELKDIVQILLRHPHVNVHVRDDMVLYVSIKNHTMLQLLLTDPRFTISNRNFDVLRLAAGGQDREKSVRILLESVTDNHLLALKAVMPFWITHFDSVSDFVAKHHTLLIDHVSKTNKNLFYHSLLMKELDDLVTIYIYLQKKRLSTEKESMALFVLRTSVIPHARKLCDLSASCLKKTIKPNHRAN